MHEQKHTKHRRRRRRAIREERALMLVLLLLVILVSVGTTLAYLSTKTESIENTFTSADVSSEVEETFDGTTKTEVSIKNTGKVDAYIRAVVIVTWVADEGADVYATKPVEDEDYKISYASEVNWKKGANDFWYFTSPVGTGESTADLIKSCTVVEGKAPEGYHLSVEIVASAIQASPETVVETQWGVTVENNVITTVPTDATSTN